MTKPKYKFDENLLKLSQSEDLQIAKKEWREIYREKRIDNSGVCICQHTLKNIIYMYNIFTKYTIIVGTGCCKKFNLQVIRVDNNILKVVISTMLKKGEYKLIDNILEYTNTIQSQLTQYIETYYHDNKSNLEKLKKLNNDIKNLINEYDLKYLKHIYDKITDQIKKLKQIEFELIINDRLELQRKINERNEIDRKNERLEVQMKINEHNEINRKKSIEDEIREMRSRERNIIGNKHIENNICKCQVKNCICEIPKYKLCRLNNNYYCETCNNWKCRCKPDREM